MGDRNLFLGPHGEDGTEHRGIGGIGAMGQGTMPPMVPMTAPWAYGGDRRHCSEKCCSC